MTRLIDADALIQIFEEDEKNLADREFQLAAIGAANTVRKMPTVDAEPVIRCKDCKHRKLRSREKVWTCLFSDWIFPEHYCSYAKRKEE